MASLYVVLYQFTSATNAKNFIANNSGIDASLATVSTSTGDQPGNWVVVFPENLNQLPGGFTTQFTYNGNTQMITQFTPGLDITTISITAADGTPIFYKGLPVTDLATGPAAGLTGSWIPGGWSVQYKYPSASGKGQFFTWMTLNNPGGQHPTIRQVVNSTLTGTTLYDTTFNGPDFTNVNGMAIQDDTANIYLVKRDGGGTIFRLDGSQNVSWSMQMPVGSGPLNHVAIDADGNLLVLGPGATTVQKYAASSGLFMLQVPTGVNSSAYRINFCSDRSNNIVVAAMVTNPGGSPQTTLISKYNSSGNLAWSSSFQGQATESFFTNWNMVRNMVNAPNGDIYWDDFVSITCINGSTGAVRWQKNYSSISQPDPIFGNGEPIEGFGIDVDLKGAVYVATSSGILTDSTNDFKTYSYGNVISYFLDGTVQQNIPVRLSIEEFAVSSNSIFIATDAGQEDGASDFISSGWSNFPLSNDSNGNFIIPNSVANISNYTITGHRPTPEDPATGLTPAFVWSQQVT